MSNHRSVNALMWEKILRGKSVGNLRDFSFTASTKPYIIGAYFFSAKMKLGTGKHLMVF